MVLFILFHNENNYERYGLFMGQPFMIRRLIAPMSLLNLA